MSNSMIIKLIIIYIFVLFLSSCSSQTKTEKAVITLNSNISNIQNQVKKSKNSITTIKNDVVRIQKEQPNCNVNAIRDEIDILDMRINIIDNNIVHLKEQTNVTKDVAILEINSYKQKYRNTKTINYILFFAILLLIIKKVKSYV